MTRKAAITAIEYYLPETVLTNQALASEFPDWSMEKIEDKTGIRERHIASASECSSDLAFAAARKLFDSGAARPSDVQMLLLCTQSPDYFLPTTACLLQDRLQIPTSAGALDFNLGCSGFVYGLALAKGLIESGQAETVLLLTADTYSKFINPSDRSVRTLFGDAGAATLIQALPHSSGLEYIGQPVWGSDGQGARNLIVPAGATRSMAAGAAAAGNSQEVAATLSGHLYMNGPEVFNFTVRTVPGLVRDVLARSGKTLDDVDLFVFHQPNQYLLSHLRRKIGIPEEKFYVSLQDCGNTVSSTIPIALKRACLDGSLKPGALLLLAGFGVGYSWAGALLRWPELASNA